MTTTAIACGAAVAVGILGLLLSWPGGSDGVRSGPPLRWAASLRSRISFVLGAAAVGLVLGALTGWPVAVPCGVAAVYGIPRLLRGMSGSQDMVKIEAVAAWTEMLQGTLAASAGLSQAIVATAPLSPMPIRGATNRLGARLSAGANPREALLEFADEVEDQSADRVVCALLLAFSARAQRVGELLGALAESTREEVALRLRIETSRASVRSGVRTVTVFSVVFAVGLTIFAHSYLAPFGSSTGQIVLACIALLYGCGLTLMVSLSRPPAAVRLLGEGVVTR